MNCIKRRLALITFCTVSLIAPAVSQSTSLESRAASAAAAAEGSSCSGLSFYWEIGNAAGEFRGGQKTTNYGKPISRWTRVPIASAGKWIYATYAVEKSGGSLDPVHDVPFLNFTSGYDKLRPCFAFDTVASCGSSMRTPFSSASFGRFSYSAGHMQHHAASDVYRSLGVSELRTSALGSLIAKSIGIQSDTQISNPEKKLFQPKIPIGLKYSGPELGADAAIDAGTYADLLQRILRRSLLISEYLGADKVCASDQVDRSGRFYCSSDGGITTDVVYAPPLPSGLDGDLPKNGAPWEYSLGHWVERDGTFSAPGSYGFYPWIDKDMIWYGVLSRYSPTSVLEYQDSLICGRAIRNAWLNAN